MDFGNTHKCVLKDLRRLRGVSSNFLTLPPYCYQCALAFIQPSQVNAPDGVWRPEAVEMFVDKTDGIEIQIEVSIFTRKFPIKTVDSCFTCKLNLFKQFSQVYSVIDGIVRVFIMANGVSINDYLIEQKVAEHCEESYMSKVNTMRISVHEFRLCLVNVDLYVSLSAPSLKKCFSSAV